MEDLKSSLAVSGGAWAVPHEDMGDSEAVQGRKGAGG